MTHVLAIPASSVILKKTLPAIRHLLSCSLLCQRSALQYLAP